MQAISSISHNGHHGTDDYHSPDYSTGYVITQLLHIHAWVRGSRVCKTKSRGRKTDETMATPFAFMVAGWVAIEWDSA